jgi:hypothetical protein
MILRFGVENHRSIRDYQEISFARSALKGPEHVTWPSPGAKRGVLPVMALYGANASGKSNVLAALATMQEHVVKSHVSLGPTDPMPRRPFLLGPQRDQPSRFDLDLVVGGVRYHYGFVVHGRGVEEEWLYAWPEGHQQLWLHRVGTDRSAWRFGPRLKGERARIASFTRDNSLFLSAAAQNNHPQLGPLFQAFATGIQIAWPKNTTDRHFFASDRDILGDPRLRALLRSADLGVADVRVEDRQQEFDQLLASMRASGDPAMVHLMEQTVAAGPPRELVLGHAAADGVVFLQPNDESVGTRALRDLGVAAIGALDAGTLLAVDEIDRGMHPDLAKALIGLFTDPATNPNGAQLLFTTHDQSILEVLRRDEVVIVEKDAGGGTSLTPVSAYRTLRRDNLRTSYAEGRYGGIPRLGRFRTALGAS